MKTLRNTAAALVLTFAGLPISGALAAAEAPQAEPLALVGEGTLKVLFWSIYHSRLYCPDGVYEPGVRPLRLEIEYLRAIKREDLVERTAEEWDKLGVTDPARKRWLARLAELWPDVAKNDVLALELDRSGRATFRLNGDSLGVVEDPAFGEHFVDIWLSPETSRPKLRLALTGGRES